MEVINGIDINITFPNAFRGSFAIVNECEYNGQIFAYKQFKDKNYLKENISKIKKLSTFELDWGILPKILVYNEKTSTVDGYLSDFSEYKKGIYLDQDKNKVDILFNIKRNIEQMHECGIIHGDLHVGNILIEQHGLNNKIIDFDNCAYKRYRIKNRYVSNDAMAYIKRYGVNKGLDIFLFNIFTYIVLYSSFSAYHEESICNLLLRNPEHCNEYLIDKYDKRNIKK